MSGAVSSSQRREVAVFKPEEARRKIDEAEVLVAAAKKLRDPESLEVSVDRLLDQWEDVVLWWKENVRKRGNQPNNRERRYLTQEQAQDAIGFTQQQVSRAGRRLQKRDEWRAAIVQGAMKKILADDKGPALETHNTGDPEGYTPAKYIEASRRALGSIDTDPASNDKAQTIVQAARYFTAKDDGLKKNWDGNVFLNPPYNSGVIERFIGKLFTEIAARRTKAAILLTNNNTDTRWFHESARSATAICLTKGRINFYKADDSTVSPTNGQAFFYFGEDIETFKREFSEIGLVMVKA